jgi:hypothetical protein
VAKWQNCQRAKLECKRQRPDGSPLRRPITKIIECRLDTLDRLLRYETHADRSLTRALDTLARLRGVTVETLSATVTRAVIGSTSASHSWASSAKAHGLIRERTTTQIAVARFNVRPS